MCFVLYTLKKKKLKGRDMVAGLGCCEIVVNQSARDSSRGGVQKSIGGGDSS